MTSCIKCELCEHPGTLENATDKGVVPCNVRAFRENVFTVWRCTGCGSLHCVEEVDLPLYYSRYPLKNQKMTFHERIGYNNRLRFFEKQGLTKTDKILDYGCGAGLFVNFARKQGYNGIVGYDPYVSEFSDENSLLEKYDAVISYDVIEHFDDCRTFIRTLASLVKNNGIVAIGTPNADNLSISRPKDPSLHMPYHRHILSERVLLALGKEQLLFPKEIRLRSFYDSIIPTVNSRFLWSHIEKCGFLDAAVEPPQLSVVFGSASLIFAAFFGYFFPRNDYMQVIFKRGITS